MVAPSVKVVLLFAVFVGSLNAAILSSPVVNDEPNYKEYAKMARFLVHRLDWMSMATISADPPTLGYPMAGVISHSDSAIGEKSTGEVYMFLTDLDQHEQNLNQNNKLTLLFAMAQYKNCSDPMEPTCARLMMTGTRVKLVPGTEEHAFGMNALLSRHPNAVHWDLTHTFYLAKVNIQYLTIQDYYGSPVTIPLADYWAADPDAIVTQKTYRRVGRRRFYQPRRMTSPTVA